MYKPLALLVLLAPACSHSKPPVVPKSFVTKMAIEGGKDSVLECNTGSWTGRITILPEVKVGYQNVSVTSANAASSKTTLTLNEVLMTIESDGLRFGTDTFVPLKGEVEVSIRQDGIHVGGAKKADLPSK